MALILLIVYILILILQIVLFVLSIRRKKKKLWLSLFGIEFITILIARGLMVYYDKLPGYGEMPGFTYLGEILFSYAATVVYSVFFVISICGLIVTEKLKRKIH